MAPSPAPLPFDAVLFDLDGTLVATERFWPDAAREACLEAFPRLGIERPIPPASVWMHMVGQPLEHALVNFPEVALPAHPGSRGLLHVHENRPGVLSHVNDRISESDANIDAQFLQTLGHVGYVVVDFQASRTDAEALRAAVAAMPGTLRTRLLY